jgi:hypothetical protein
MIKRQFHTGLGRNHWSIVFPDRFSALSTLLDIRASDTVTLLTDTGELYD